LSEAVFPIAPDKAGDARIVVGGRTIVREIIEQSEQSATDSRTAELDNGVLHSVGRTYPGLRGHSFAIDPPLDAILLTVVANLIEMPLAAAGRNGLAQDRVRGIRAELLARTGKPLIKGPNPD
jgi:hypothetical protein